MSVIVKGMEMPESCSNCELCACYAESRGDVYRCDITMYPVKYFEKRLDNCPLVEVPQHGDLIDRDELRASFAESVKECNKWANEVPQDTMMYARISQAEGTFVECSLRAKAMPTIIEAEVEE